MRVFLTILFLASTALAQTPTFPPVTAWAECSFSDPNGMATVWRAIPIWQALGITPIIGGDTTESTRVLTKFVHDFPGVPVIPYIKTSSAPPFGKPDDPNHWNVVRSCAVNAVAVTGSQFVVLECEADRQNYTGHEDPNGIYVPGNYVMNWPRFAACVGALPRDVYYAVYPGIGSYPAEHRERERLWCAAFADALPVGHYIPVSFGWSSLGATTYPPAIECEAANAEIAQAHDSYVVDIAYTHCTWCWLDSQTPDMLAGCPHPVIVYPGTHMFGAAAAGIAQAGLYGSTARARAAEASNVACQAAMDAANALVATLRASLTDYQQRLTAAQTAVCPP